MSALGPGPGSDWVVVCHPDDVERVALMDGVGGPDGAQVRAHAVVPRGKAYVMPAVLAPDLDLPAEEVSADWRELLAELREHYAPHLGPRIDPPETTVRITAP